MRNLVRKMQGDVEVYALLDTSRKTNRRLHLLTCQKSSIAAVLEIRDYKQDTCETLMLHALSSSLPAPPIEVGAHPPATARPAASGVHSKNRRLSERPPDKAT